MRIREKGHTQPRGAHRSTTSMASSITPTGSTTCSSPPPWEGENYEPRNPMESGALKPDVNFPVNIRPLRGRTQRSHQGVECRLMCWRVLEPGEEVERLALREIATMEEPSCHRRQVLQPNLYMP